MAQPLVTSSHAILPWAIGQGYADFYEVSDEEVRQMLGKAWNEPAEEKT